MARATLFVGTDAGLYRLVPGHEPVACGPSDISIRALAIDCHRPTHLMAGGRGKGVMLERADGGLTWSELVRGLPKIQRVRSFLTG